MQGHIVKAACLAVLFGTAPSGAATFDLTYSLVPAGQHVDRLDGPGMVVSTGFDARQSSAFTVAESFIESVILGFTGVSGTAQTVVSAFMAPIDGALGTIAFSQPVDNEFESRLIRATHGVVQFDNTDWGADRSDTSKTLSFTMFVQTIVHETLHALGFGTLFEVNDLADGPTYVGANAVAAFNEAYGRNVPSILMDKQGEHWSECWRQWTDCDPAQLRDSELMTPEATPSATLSPVTIAAFRDLGYITVDPFAAPALPDAVSVEAPAATVPLPASGFLLIAGLGLAAIQGRTRRARRP